MTKLTCNIWDCIPGSRFVTVLKDDDGFYPCVMHLNSGAKKGLHYLDIPPFWEKQQASDERFILKRDAKVVAIEWCDKMSLTFVEGA